MSNRLIAAALATRLSQLGLPTAYENSPYTPEADEIYLSESFLPAATAAVGMADGSLNDYVGIYQVDVRAPRNQGKGAALAVVEQVEAHFPRNLVMTYSGIEVRTTREAFRGPAIIDGSRWSIPVTIRYRALA